MASEATINTSLQITKGSLQYRSNPTAFRADVSGSGGPTPGTITATNAGTDVSLTQLTTPGLCRIQNLSTDYEVEVGVWNADQSEFYPLLALLPGETFVIRLSTSLNKEYEATGTGTSSELNTLRIKVLTGATAQVLVEAFDR